MALFPELLQRPLFSEIDYLSMLRKLLPRGPIWGWDQNDSTAEVLQVVKMPAENPLQNQPTGFAAEILQDIPYIPRPTTDQPFRHLMSCLAAELARVEDAAWSLFNESIPGLSTELLPDHERVLGLPDRCTISVFSDMDTRRRVAHAKMYGENQDTTEQFFIDYADTLGFSVWLEEGSRYSEASICGVAKTGRNRTAGRNMQALIVVHITAGPHDPAQLAALQCIFLKVKPAHVYILWSDDR